MTDEIFRLKPGQSARFSVPLTILGASVPTLLPVSLVLTLECRERGATDAPIVDASPVYDGSGVYHSDQVIPIGATPGQWVRRWQATGPSPSQCALHERQFLVLRLDF